MLHGSPCLDFEERIEPPRFACPSTLFPSVDFPQGFVIAIFASNSFVYGRLEILPKRQLDRNTTPATTREPIQITKCALSFPAWLVELVEVGAGPTLLEDDPGNAGVVIAKELCDSIEGPAEDNIEWLL